MLLEKIPGPANSMHGAEGRKQQDVRCRACKASEAWHVQTQTSRALLRRALVRAGVFLAFLDYHARRRVEAFLELLTLAPMLEQQMYAKLLEIQPSMDWSIFNHHALRAVQDPQFGQAMAVEFAQSFIANGRRALVF